MKCETCGRDMHWEGSIRTGHMACGKCEGSDEPNASELLRQAAAEFQRKVDANKQNDNRQIDMYKAMVGQEASIPVPLPTVKWLCLKCGHNIIGMKGRDPKDYSCPRCGTYGSLKEVK